MPEYGGFVNPRSELPGVSSCRIRIEQQMHAFGKNLVKGGYGGESKEIISLEELYNQSKYWIKINLRMFNDYPPMDEDILLFTLRYKFFYHKYISTDLMENLTVKGLQEGIKEIVEKKYEIGYQLFEMTEGKFQEGFYDGLDKLTMDCKLIKSLTRKIEDICDQYEIPLE